jgi:hypothetical protein
MNDPQSVARRARQTRAYSTTGSPLSVRAIVILPRLSA